MVFTSSQAETWGPLEESCCGEAGRLRRQQHSTRMKEDTQHPELRIMQRRVLTFIWNAAVPLIPYSLGALFPLLGWHSKHAQLSAPWLARFQRRQSTLDQLPEDVARGPLWWVLYPQQARPSWPWRGPWVSTGTCKLQTRSSAAAPALWAQMEALQEQKPISGWPSRAAVACPSRDEPQPFAASPGNRCCSWGEPAATLAASTEGLCACSWGGQTSAAQLYTSFI